MRRSGALVAALAIMTAGVSRAPAQTSTTRQDSDLRFTTASELVLVPVSVLDRNGRHVPDLTIEDFTVTDEGRPQRIRAFEHIQTAVAATRPAALDRPWPSDVASNEFTREGRAFLLVFDDIHVDSRRTDAALKLMNQFLEEHVQPQDLVAVVPTSGQRGVHQDFTQDHPRVRQAIAGLNGLKRGGDPFLDAVTDARVTMDVLGRLADHLSRERHRRVAILLVSEGIDYNIYNGFDPKANDVLRYMEGAIQALRRANVVLYAVDPRGLHSTVGEDIDRPALSSFSSSTAHPTLERAQRGATAVTAPSPNERLQLSLQSLSRLSEATGGSAAINSNDYTSAFSRMADEVGNYYLLGYEPDRRGRPGELREIDVKVALPGVQVSARKGYVVPRERPAAPRTRPDTIGRSLESALLAALPKPDLPIRVQAVALPAAQEKAQVQLIIEVPGTAIGEPLPDGGLVERLEFALMTVDRDGVRGHGKEAVIDVRLEPEQLEPFRLTGIRWLDTLELPPGRFVLRVAGRAAHAGRTGSVFTDVDVVRAGSEPQIAALALTSGPAALAMTVGRQSMFPQLPVPPTTVRTFVRGDRIHVTAAVHRGSSPESGEHVRVSVTRADDGGARPIERMAPILRSPEGYDYVMAAIDTTTLPPGSYVLRLTFVDRPNRGTSTILTVVARE